MQTRLDLMRPSQLAKNQTEGGYCLVSPCVFGMAIDLASIIRKHAKSSPATRGDSLGRMSRISPTSQRFVHYGPRLRIVRWKLSHAELTIQTDRCNRGDEEVALFQRCRKAEVSTGRCDRHVVAASLKRRVAR
jgi:hypothetical protein